MGFWVSVVAAMACERLLDNFACRFQWRSISALGSALLCLWLRGSYVLTVLCLVLSAFAGHEYAGIRSTD